MSAAVPPPRSVANIEEDPNYKYKHLLPVHIPKSYPPLVPFEHTDPGSRALFHKNPQAFLAKATRITNLTPQIGTEVDGVQLLDLSDDGKDQLALFVAQRRVVAFRNQLDFIDAGTEAYKEWGRYFGSLHIHPVSGHPEGVPEIHLVYRSPTAGRNFHTSWRVTSAIWHSDSSYERQPPGLTAFFLLDSPECGGDTVFISQVESFKKLSEPFKTFLRTLTAVHSGVEQANQSRYGLYGGIVRREPVQHIHPVVRRHPVTGEEALFVNRQFTRRIVGLKVEESDTLLNFLYDHIAKAIETQARVKWEPGTVVLWDNRITSHSAIVDFDQIDGRRHGARITPQAERPIPANPDLVVPDGPIEDNEMKYRGVIL